MAVTPVLAAAGDGDPGVTPGDWDFGRVPVGEASDPVRFELFNQGTGDLAVSDVSVGSDAFDLTGDNCSGSVLAAGQTCEFDIRFAPQKPGKYLSIAEVQTDAAPEPLVVGLSGEATTPYLVVEPESLDFGSQTGLPRFFDKGLRGFLHAFHVTPRDALAETLDADAREVGGTATLRPLYRDYAVIGHLSLPGG